MVEESIKFVKDNKSMSGSALEIIEFCIYDEETLEQFKLVFNAIERWGEITMSSIKLNLDKYNEYVTLNINQIVV